MGFSVEPEAVCALGNLVARAGDAADTYRVWFDRVAGDGSGQDTEHGEGFLAQIWPKLDEWQEMSQSLARSAVGLAGTAGTELCCAGCWYSAVDKRVAERLDGIHPEPDAAPVPPDDVPGPGEARKFRDALPVGYAGPDQHKLEDPSWWPVKAWKEAEELTGLGGSLGDVAALIKVLTGSDKDFIEMLGDALVGDWSVLQKQAVVYADAAEGFGKIAVNIKHGQYGIQEPWTGEAADRAKNWLAAYHSAVTQLAQYFDHASQVIQALAQTAYHLMQTIRHSVSAAIDIALLILAEGKTIALKSGEDLVEVIQHVLASLGRGGNIIEFLENRDLVQLVHLVLSFLDAFGIAQTAVSTLLGWGHQIAMGEASARAAGITIAAAEPPRWPEFYEHRDAECPAKRERARL
ncbi:hypothetical protein [Amycolatopsis suaedae]|uniref:Uncharacterized protein n=1 Tax=Amycolatopsis suaedae TaxID=2510978 RepID=A0A4Q7IZ02_9PSEU|nr:hypothetical protein [Amycolatopsis suaedae]RZQ60251.1 hypothetical protein EWH70_30165 [Amycolatopsis suaedae]